MGEPFIGEIRIFAGNFAPLGWAFCDGQLLPIATYEALFALIGTTYGGDGQTTFALPDLRGRGPIHQGTGPGLTPRTMGETLGQEAVTLTTAQAPVHSHPWATAPNGGTSKLPSGYLAPSTSLAYAAAGGPTTALASTTIAAAGGAQPHENMAPFLTLSFIIALEGIFPSPS
jgi:microcystin-dependent protein